MMIKRFLSIFLATAMVINGSGIAYAAENIPEESFVLEIEGEAGEDENREPASEIELESEENLVDLEIEDEKEEEKGDFSIEDLQEENIADLKIEDEQEDNTDNSQNEYHMGYVMPENPIPVIHKEKEDGEASFDGASSIEYQSKFITEKLPPLRNQNPYGTCWAFATMALVEINLMKKGVIENPDLSELHLAYFSYNSVVDPLGGTEDDYNRTAPSGILNLGGNYEPALATLAKWTGAADEETAKYTRDDAIASSIGLQDDIAYDDKAHVQNYYIEEVDMSEFRSNKDLSMLNPIKKLIYENGAAGIVFSALNSISPTVSSSTYSEKYNSYYNNDYGTGWHAVVVVGWDDDFPKEHFSMTPPGDGAFLVRNSWTTEGEGNSNSYAGYFWMSYYENSLQDEFYAADAENYDNYDNNYQYDSDAYSSIAYKSGANVFTTHADGGTNGEILKAVSFYTISTNSEYKIEIYKDVVDTPDSGTLVGEATTSGTLDFSGYHTIQLKEEVFLPKDTKFAVVVTLDTNALLAEFGYHNSDSGLGSKPGQSFRFVGSGWLDRGSQGNFRIKAFTCNAAGDQIVPATDIEFSNFADETRELGVDETFKVKARVLPAESDRTIIWSSSAPSVATVNNGQIVGKTPGTALVTAETKDGSVSKTISVTVVNKLLAISLSAYQVFDFINGGQYIQYEASFKPADYKPIGEVVFSSSDDSVASIDSEGKITQKRMGITTISVSLDGKSCQSTFVVKPSRADINYVISDDKNVTFKWEGSNSVESYEIYRKNELIATIEGDDRGSYEYTDDYFKNTEVESASYKFWIRIDHSIYQIIYEVKFGTTYNITYYLNGGTQNPNNPLKYVSGNSYTLYDPVPPEGYTFEGWYTDSALNNSKSSIYESDEGDITFYAKYNSIAPKPSVTSISVDILTVSNKSGKKLAFKYTGSEYTPEYLFDNSRGKAVAVVKHGKKKLTYGVDYTIEAVDDEYASAGTHTFILKGISKAESEYDSRIVSYVGEKVFTFEIQPISISSANIAGLKTSVEYTGNALTVADLFNASNKTCQKAGWNELTLCTVDSKTKAKTVLVNGRDYTVTIGERIGVGKVSVVFTGIGNYKGTIKKNVTIKARNIAKDMDVTVSNAIYTKAGVKPSVTVTYNGKSLVEGTDYTVSIKNNKKAALSTDKSAPYVTVKAKGNYSGTSGKFTFDIVRNPVTNLQIQVKDIAFKAKGSKGYFIAKPTFTDGGKKVTVGKNKDISAVYTYTYAEDTTLVGGTVKMAGDVVEKTDKLAGPTSIMITAQIEDSGAKSNYDGAATLTYVYRIYKK